MKNHIKTVLAVTGLIVVSSTTSAVAALSFHDVRHGDTHQESIDWVVHMDIMQGYDDGTFRPDQPLTRGQYATTLYNMYGPQDDDVAVSPNPPVHVR